MTSSVWSQWTMAECTVHTGSPAKFPTKPTEKWKKNRKMCAIKQIKIYAEYRDMLPRPRLDLLGTPGHRPIGLSPGSWQTSLGLGSMSRYSAQMLICIIYIYISLWMETSLLPSVWLWMLRVFWGHLAWGQGFQVQHPLSSQTYVTFGWQHIKNMCCTLHCFIMWGCQIRH